MKTSKDSLKIGVSGEFALRHVNLPIQKTTADDDKSNNLVFNSCPITVID